MIKKNISVLAHVVDKAENKGSKLADKSVRTYVDPEEIKKVLDIGEGGGSAAILYETTGQNTDGAMTQKATTDALTLKADSSSLATVATTGDYTDLSNTPSPYSLPTASANDLGGVKVGTGLSIDANGALSATGGSSVTLYNSLGENTDGAITQKASREMIWATPAQETVFIGTAAQGATITSSGAIVLGRNIRNASMTGNVTIGGSSQTVWNDDVAVGANANAGSHHCTAVGGYSQATGLYSTAVGKNANAARNGSTALGAYAVTTRQGEVNVGTSSYNYGYDGTNTRVIGGVHAGVQDTDAVNVAQLNTAVGDIEAALTTLNSGIGA